MAALAHSDEIRRQSDQFDVDDNGHITGSQIGHIFKTLGEDVPDYKIRNMIKKIHLDENGTVGINEVFKMYKKVLEKAEKLETGCPQCLESRSRASEAATEGMQDPFLEEEKVEFVHCINLELENELDMKHKLPIEEGGNSLFSAVEDGIIFCKLPNCVAGFVLYEADINKGKLNKLAMHENQTLAINSASWIGCDVDNIRPQD